MQLYLGKDEEMEWHKKHYSIIPEDEGNDW